MTFLNPLVALIPKTLFPFFAEFWVWVTSEARGSVSVGLLGVPSIEPLGGASSQGALSTPPHWKPAYPRLLSPLIRCLRSVLLDQLQQQYYARPPPPVLAGKMAKKWVEPAHPPLQPPPLPSLQLS